MQFTIMAPAAALQAAPC